ncbi:RNA recognition motif-containing protein [Hanseniaspora osmophila]
MTSVQEDNLDNKTLFVRSVPFDASDEEFTNFFAQFAPVRHAVIVKDGEQKSRGFGFVNFADEDDAKQALGKARRTKFKNKLIRIDIAKRRERKGNKRSTSEETSIPDDEAAVSLGKESVIDDSTGEKNEEDDGEFKGQPKLIIRNMPWSCRDPTKLTKIFSRYGTVDNAYIPRKAGGRMSGFAFVVMKKISACRRAIEESKSLKIDGRQVAVDFAVSKNRWDEHKDESDVEEGIADENKSDEKSVINEENAKTDEPNSDQEDVSKDEQEKEEEKVIERPKKNRKENFSVFVRNVPYDATEESLEYHFGKFGSVKFALPVTDKETGLPKGTAFVAFHNEESYQKCISDAPDVNTTSLLISDDVKPEYVYEGRVLSITPTLDRENANKAAEKKSLQRKEALGKAPADKDKRNLFLLNEGRINEQSKLAALLTKQDLEVREKSYKQRVDQLKSNPSLHLSLTRLAIRNLPRSMTEKSLKALGRKAVVEFATEVKEGKRHALNKEELDRSTKAKYKGMSEEEIELEKNKKKKHGVIKQAKIIMEVKGSTVGRSRGYGFIEFRDHKTALMGLRWLNAHEVSKEEVLEGLTDEEKKGIDHESFNKRRLVVEFAVENTTVLKRRQERVYTSRKRSAFGDSETRPDRSFKKQKTTESLSSSTLQPENKNKSGMSDDVKRLIGIKRKRRSGK